MSRSIKNSVDLLRDSLTEIESTIADNGHLTSLPYLPLKVSNVAKNIRAMRKRDFYVNVEFRDYHWLQNDDVDIVFARYDQDDTLADPGKRIKQNVNANANTVNTVKFGPIRGDRECEVKLGGLTDKIFETTGRFKVEYNDDDDIEFTIVATTVIVIFTADDMSKISKIYWAGRYLYPMSNLDYKTDYIVTSVHRADELLWPVNVGGAYYYDKQNKSHRLENERDNEFGYETKHKGDMIPTMYIVNINTVDNTFNITGIDLTNADIVW